MDPRGLILIAIGAFSLCGAIFDWDWFMNNHRARFFSAILGRNGARGFYALLGIGLAVFGILVTLGLVAQSR